MRIRTESDGSNFLIDLAGRFDAHEVPAFRIAIDPLLSVDDPRLHLDLSNVVFIDSTALSELVRAQKAVDARSGELVLVGLSDPVRIILELTALLSVFTVETGAGRTAPSA